jgi:DNA-directed RNA polymerase subunit RPC12/RpoP
MEKVRCAVCGSRIGQGDDLFQIEIYKEGIFKRLKFLCGFCGKKVLEEVIPEMKREFEEAAKEVKWR